jgi:predicted alpha/beta hydrolase family esterase
MMVAHRNGAILVISGNPDNKTNINGALLVGNNDVNKKAGILNLFANVDYSQNVVRDKLPSTDLLLGH